MQYDNELFVKHLQGMVQIPTVSSVDPDKIDKDAFLRLHKYLEETYPLVHKTFEKRGHRPGWACCTIGRAPANLAKSLCCLTAHQDVVPEGDHSMWKYPPYEGVVADGCLWGRGSTDSKCNIQAYLDALELLIADGFVPDYDIYLAFGYNEEIMGGPEAAAGILSEELKKRGVTLGMAVDECGGVSQRDGKWVAEIYPCEKGYADFEFSMEDPGGHSAQPPEHSALGVIGHTAWLIEQNPLPQKLTAPVIQQMKAMAPFTPGELGQLFQDPESQLGKAEAPLRSPINSSTP